MADVGKKTVALLMRIGRELVRLAQERVITYERAIDTYREGDPMRALMRDLTHRNKAVAERMSVSTNYVRIIEDCACMTQPGKDALAKHQSVFGKKSGK